MTNGRAFDLFYLNIRITSSVLVYKSQDFAQIQQNFAWSHDRVTVTFRNSVLTIMKLYSKQRLNLNVRTDIITKLGRSVYT